MEGRFCCFWVALLVLGFALLVTVALGATDPGDFEIIEQFRDGLSNPELLKWPETGGDPCGAPRWNHLVCSGDRVTQIQVQNLGLEGPLPQNLNKLSKLTNLGLQRNKFSGTLPTLSGLSDLRYAFFDFNDFDSIPADFCTGLENLEVLALDYNNFNSSSGWSFPSDLKDSAQLTNLTCNDCNLVGSVPGFLGDLASLQVLLLSGNNLSGSIPASFNGSTMRMLWLNDQRGEKMSGSIDIVATMESLTSLWLHGNHFTGSIPEKIGDLALLKDLNLNGNDLVGLVPDSLASMDLNALDLNNNMLMGPIPEFKAVKASYSSNAFCESTPGVACSPEVMALIEFLGGLNYPSRLVEAWSGNEPCAGPWLGIDCDKDGKVSVINLPGFNLSGTLSPSVGRLESLTQVRLESNDLGGSVPVNWTGLKSLTRLDLSGNNISPPLPEFGSSVKVVVSGNPLLDGGQSGPPPSGGNGPSSGGSSRSSAKNPSSTGEAGVDSDSPVKNPSSTGEAGVDSDSPVEETKTRITKRVLVIIVPVVIAFVIVIIFVSIYCCKKKKGDVQVPRSLVVHPRDPSDPNNTVKIVVADNANGSTSTLTGSGSASRNSSAIGDSHVIETGNLVISVQVLRNVTKNFATENELGRGGFGVVYKGDLEDGTKIAVKRMESGVITRKALDEFQSEIAVLSKVRHRHLVSLLGYSVEGNERLLVYEYMPQGALSKHLFHWKSFELEPLSWKRRLNIALDVARGLEYLHNLAHQSFIHRDLKSSNILLGDDFRAKISDFGLVKLAPNGEKRSVVTRLAGTFGYLAPEYAVTGKITTKVDVFSFGVVLMELLTGLMALDDNRPEESQYLAAWFWNIKSDKDRLMAAIDPALGAKEDIFESIISIAELAGHCTAREPNQRPDMGHAVNVLGPLVEKWKPFHDDPEEYSGIDYSLPLNQMVKDWQEAEGKDFSYMDLEDSKGSIPAMPNGFAESFTSADGR